MNGIELRNLRKKLDLNQGDLAKLLGVSRETVYNWEKKEKLSQKAERLISNYLKGQNINISISENKAGGDQNFFNEHTETKGNKNIEEINRLRNEIEILTIENKKLTKQLIECKNQLIECLTKK